MLYHHHHTLDKQKCTRLHSCHLLNYCIAFSNDDNWKKNSVFSVNSVNVLADFITKNIVILILISGSIYLHSRDEFLNDYWETNKFCSWLCLQFPLAEYLRLILIIISIWNNWQWTIWDWQVLNFSWTPYTKLEKKHFKLLGSNPGPLAAQATSLTTQNNGSLA